VGYLRLRRGLRSLVLLATFGSWGWSVRAEPRGTADHAAAYLDTIKPLLAERCYACHGGLAQEAGLRLDTVSLMEKGGDSGAAIVRGKPTESLLLERVADPDPVTRMPPEGEGEPLSREQLAAVAAWLAAGAPGPENEQPEEDPRQHWAFQPRVRLAVPAAGLGWATNPIDAFLAAKHAEHGLRPQAEAPRHVLVRRLYLDLLGLPPEPADLAAIEADASTDWYERLVDRLLADPRHGERWGRHWMDVWRYADWWGLGEEHRNSQKHMWHFRDWIVESLNADVPYDEMLRQMLAADELYPLDDAKLRATGFLARNYFSWNRTQWLDETVEHVGKGLLGLTMNCSKCHDHKYDPIQQEDFYRMRAFFEPYHCRLDVVRGELNLAQDGVPRVFDAMLDAPTYLFVRGEESLADKTRPISPGVPDVFEFHTLAIKPVALPLAAWQPGRRTAVIETHRAIADRGVSDAEAALAAAIAKRQAVVDRLAGAARPRSPAAPVAIPETPFLAQEDFAEPRPNRWRALAGDWRHEPGRLVQRGTAQAFSMLQLAEEVPPDFEATVTFTTLGGTWRSVGVVFDVAGDGSSTEQMVYISGAASGQKVQAALKAPGSAWQYPENGARTIVLAADKPHTLRLAVRDTLVNVWLDDAPVLAWRSPVARRPGGLQLLTFDATVAFQGFTLRPLPPEVVLRERDVATPGGPSPTAESVRLEVVVAERRLEVARKRQDHVAAMAAWAAVDAGPATGDTPASPAARKAAQEVARAEREIAAAFARQGLAEAELALAQATIDLRQAAVVKVEAALAAVTQAEQAVAHAGEAFTPFVGAAWSPTKFTGTTGVDPTPPFPPTSTGRRTALAEWISLPTNPLTARVAVNHIWMRHFGRPLVTTVFDFGRKGNRPDHPELLDWLASELVDGPSAGTAWSMKHLHRLIVTSTAYRMASTSLGRDAEAQADPDNRFLWRRDQIRLEAEVIRDSLLTIASMLDDTRGGPSVHPAEQAASRRRSLYFFHSGGERNPLLKTFDVADVTECYQRDQSIVPQQALALANAAFVRDMAVAITTRIGQGMPADAGDKAFLDAAFRLILGRSPSAAETAACAEAVAAWQALPEPLAEPAAIRENLVWALLNHNDFVVLR
jgi:mono/diheme cytochrome c family protein